MSSILREDQYFDNEADFCRVENSQVKAQLEKVFLENRISYFVKWEDKGFLERLFGSKKENGKCIIRINNRDIAKAMQLVKGVNGIEIIGKEPVSDWSPKEKIRRMQESERSNRKLND